MKKFLLTMIVTMLSFVGAWAEPTSWGTDNKGTWEVDGTTLTVTFASQADWNGLSWGSEPWTSSETGLTKVVLKFSDEFDNSANPGQDIFYHFTQKINTVTTLDLSALSTEFLSSDNVKNDLKETKHYPVGFNGQVSTIILPDSYEYNSSQNPWKNYTISGGVDLNAGGGETPANNFGTASSWSYTDGTLTIDLNASSDLQESNWGYGQSCPWASESGNISNVVLKPASDVEFNSNVLYIFFEGKAASTLDLSNLTAEQVDQLKSSQNLDKIYNNRSKISLKLPEGYEYDSSQDPWKNYTISGGTDLNSGSGGEPGGEDGPGDDPKGREVIFSPADDDVNVAIGTPYQFTMSTTGYTGNNMSIATCTVTKNDEICEAAVFEVRYGGGQTLANVRHSQITTILDPKYVGDYIVTFYLSDYDATWCKDGAAVTKTITVHAYDPTIASSLELSPASPTVDMGGTTTIDVNLLPATAGLTKSDVTIVTGLDTKVDNEKDVLTVTLAGDNTSITIDATNAASTGTATFTLTPNGLSPVVVTVNVVNPRVKATATCPASVRIGDESLSASATLDGSLNPDEYDISYSSENVSVLRIDEESGALIPVSVGTTNITVTVTPKDGTSITEDPFTQTFAVEVKKGELALALSASPAALQGGKVGTSTISHTVILNGGDPTNTGYNISDYTLVSAPDGVTITGDKVSVPATVATGDITVRATITSTNDAYECTTATAEAVIKIVNEGVVLSKEIIDGKEFVVVNVINAGAFGELSDNPAVINAGASLADLKAATNVKVTGLLANSDVRELVNLLGACDNVLADVNALKCKTLDMGSATMTEAITYTSDSKCSLVSHTNQKSLVSVENLTLPRPAVGVPNGTVIPKGIAGFTAGWYTDNVSNLTTLTIPEGWTEVADEAWNTYGSQGAGVGKSLEKVSTLNLPNSLKKIGKAAFANSNVRTLYMPKNLEYIDDEAFNTASNLQDIYFTGDGKKLKFVHINAFSTQSQMTNNTVDDADFNGVNSPVTTRQRYSNGGVLACIMHYPQGCDAEYTDVTRKYKVIDTSVTPYNKGTTTYTPEGWTPEKIEEIESHIVTTFRDDLMFIEGNNIPAGFPDATYGYDFVWPSQYQMENGYLIANAGYLWSGEAMSTAQLDYTDPSNPVDKRGLYQFICGMGNAPTDKEEWPFKYSQDLWYTIALPFDMSVDDIKKVFGPQTQVCRFSEVVRDVTNAEDKVLRLIFRNSVMQESDGRPEKITYSDGVEQAGIRHHWPYMIKPSGEVDDKDPSIKFKPLTGERVYSGFQTIPGLLNEEKVTPVLKDQETIVTGKDYYFRPILMKGTLKKNSYVLTKKTETVHQFYFYKGHKGAQGYEDGGTATANTAYVQLDHGMEDLNDFFSDTPVQATSKVRFASFFGDFIDEDEATKIDRIEIVCGDDEIGNDKIYTISGVQVSGNSLTPGLYIKNGKKFIVK